MTANIAVVDDPARACAIVMAGAALGGGHIVLTGGSTPRAAYKDFVAILHMVGIDLDATTFWMGDERCVAPDDERSNYRMIRESLLDPVKVIARPIRRFHRILGEQGSEMAAPGYERELRREGVPPFDLVLLGIGPDGHCASLFPGKPEVDEQNRLVVDVPEAGLDPLVARVSLTVPALTAARHVVFLATGEGKANAVARAFGSGSAAARELPSARVAANAAQVTVLLDRDAASKLPPGTA